MQMKERFMVYEFIKGNLERIKDMSRPKVISIIEEGLDIHCTITELSNILNGAGIHVGVRNYKDPKGGAGQVVDIARELKSLINTLNKELGLNHPISTRLSQLTGVQK